MDNIGFSIIVPTYNCADYLNQCLNSISKQTYKNFEIIIVDNYSDDHTEEVVSNYSKLNLIYKKFSNNGVIAASRNYGVTFSTKEWIAFLDADDLWSEEKLQKVVELISTTSFKCYYHNLNKIDEENNFMGTMKKEAPEELSYIGLLTTGNKIPTSSVVIKKEVFKKLKGFNEQSDFITAEDYDLWLKCYRDNFKFKYLTQPLGSYRIHSGGASKALERHYNATVKVYESHIEKISLPKSQKDKGYAVIDYAIGRMYWANKEYSKAYQYFQTSFNKYKYLPKNIIMLSLSRIKSLISS